MSSVNQYRQRADKGDMRDWLYQYHCGAGRGARKKYRETHNRWQKRVFRRPRSIYVILAAPIIALRLIAPANIWLWLVEVALCVILGAYIAFVESPPARIENWRTGFEGERRTARALAPLRRRGYLLLHDLPDRRIGEQYRNGNIDHVVVSPAGVFLLDSKWLGGDASIRRGTVHVQMRDDEEDAYDLPKLACWMRSLAVRLQEDISQQTGVRFVQPVVVFWNRFEAERVVSEKVVFVHGKHLVDWLQEQRPRLTPNEVAHIASSIADVRPSEHRAWWTRRPRFGLPRRGEPAASRTAGGVASAGSSRS
jgi:hypothetical protein